MNYLLVGLTFLVMAVVLVSCVALGSRRLSGAEYVSQDGLDAPGPERGPLRVRALERDSADQAPADHVPADQDPADRGSATDEPTVDETTVNGRTVDETAGR